MTKTIEEHIDVDVPVTSAYNQWTQFESFPEFMDGVEEVQQLDDRRLHWKISIGGVKREFDAEITEQIPDERVSWRSTSGTGNAGVVTFHKLEPNETRIMLQLETDPEGVVEKVGDTAGLTTANAKGDLKRFKKFIESRQGHETGAYRGEIRNN
jgi:uncharacterized membrane protein